MELTSTYFSINEWFSITCIDSSLHMHHILTFQRGKVWLDENLSLEVRCCPFALVLHSSGGLYFLKGPVMISPSRNCCQPARSSARNEVRLWQSLTAYQQYLLVCYWSNNTNDTNHNHNDNHNLMSKLIRFYDNVSAWSSVCGKVTTWLAVFSCKKLFPVQQSFCWRKAVYSLSFTLFVSRSSLLWTCPCAKDQRFWGTLSSRIAVSPPMFCIGM